MKRIKINPRDNWKEIAKENGFYFHHINNELYWDESIYYSFTLDEIENNLEDVAKEINDMCLDFVDEACTNEKTLSLLKIPEKYWDFIYHSWKNNDKTIYGRFDFCYDGKTAKLLEYNADTPTALYVSGYFQWIWLEDCIERKLIPENSDQFNSIHEKLIEVFQQIKDFTYFGCVKNSIEDKSTIAYLMDCASQANLQNKFIYMEDIGLKDNQFVDLEDKPINNLFKLYPWEFIWNDPFSDAVLISKTKYFEPPWKMLLSNKAILPLLWKKHKNHPNLIPSYFLDVSKFIPSNYIAKPYFSREGEGIITEQKRLNTSNYIIQEFNPLPNFENNYPVCGLWIVNNQSCGLGIREDKSIITKNTSKFVPHIISC